MIDYLVWEAKYGRDNAYRVKAFDAEHAAKSWAERYDSDGNHSIVGGAEVVVFVALDQDGSTPERFEVSGEVNPVYYARSLKDSE